MTKVETLVQFCDVVKHFGAITALDKVAYRTKNPRRKNFKILTILGKWAV